MQAVAEIVYILRGLQKLLNKFEFFDNFLKIEIVTQKFHWLRMR
jgi:hypothetical protein